MTTKLSHGGSTVQPIHIVVVKISHSRFLGLVFVVRFVAKRYIPQQKCLKEQIGTCLLGTRWYNFWPCTPTMRVTMHSVTDRQTDRRTDGRQDYTNSRSYCAAVRSAKNPNSLRLLGIPTRNSYILHWTA